MYLYSKLHFLFSSCFALITGVNSAVSQLTATASLHLQPHRKRERERVGENPCERQRRELPIFQCHLTEKSIRFHTGPLWAGSWIEIRVQTSRAARPR